jgi:hypothetical protein
MLVMDKTPHSRGVTPDTMKGDFPMATKTTRKAPVKAKGSSARAVADKASAALSRTVTPKTVRQWARDHMARFQDESYTVHAYSAAEVRTILKGLGAAEARRTASKAGDLPADEDEGSDDAQ